jgi:tetratricopeptide (TPR) repeat protein
MEQQLGPDYPDVSYLLLSLALLYKEHGQYSKAKSLYGRALAIREQQLGPDHPDTATNLGYLAILYSR